ncbi:MAG TPA: excinuclease ABC subunit UvrB [Oligoflexia bacterium]|nr:excinuclease ABC subunit UvrB [Oligoflexia bacterium]HMP26573.1 excinuclease ABC subunit UvrB [Oligoflexia bacterium]
MNVTLEDNAFFELVSDYTPCGDQPRAIEEISRNLQAGAPFQTLLGVTGSGKTFAIANVIARYRKPTLVIAPNKTLAAQLYSEFKEFFPRNKVRYFISYYDYYQPEAYLPASDIYIEKESQINEEIDQMRHSATTALLEGRDVIVVASVSCIYGLGAPEDYLAMRFFVKRGETFEGGRDAFLKRLALLQYVRSQIEFERGHFRAQGEVVDVFPADRQENALRFIFFEDQIEEIKEIDALTGSTIIGKDSASIYPASHFVVGRDRIDKAIKEIRLELKQRLLELRSNNKLLEADRLERRTLYDLELLREVGFCPGIENYSRHISGRRAGEPPATLIDYFKEDFLLVIDESHITVPQLGAMYRGDLSRKTTLVDYGFRLPSAVDNRPLNQDEFWSRVRQTIFVSATPAEFEIEKSKGLIVEMINRPTGLVDPPVVIKPATGQVADLYQEATKTIAKGQRVLVTCLTKKSAEDLADFFRQKGLRSRYLHSEIEALERVELLRGLRKGDFDLLIGINLLREGLDLVEVALVAILDADKEGFLRSARSLIQTMGRAARNIEGRVILYADQITESIQKAIAESERRRGIQIEYNRLNQITPRSAVSPIRSPLSADSLVDTADRLQEKFEGVNLPTDPKLLAKLIQTLKKEMFNASAKREFEKAAELRDRIKLINDLLIKA